MKKSWVVLLAGAWLLLSCGKGMPAENTPRPTVMPYQTATQFLPPGEAQYELPGWLKNPGDHVLLSVAHSEPGENFWLRTNNHIILANADNGEQFQADVANFLEAFWQDSNHIVFVPEGPCSELSYYSVLDLSTGRLTRHAAGDAPMDLCHVDAPELRAMISYDPGEDGNFSVAIQESRNYTSETFPVENDGLKNLGAELSPDQKHLVVLQGSKDGGQEDRFLIYDFEAKKLLEEYPVTNAKLDFHFTSDGKHLVYLEKTQPCILDIEKLKRQCGIPIPDQSHWIYFQGFAGDETSILYEHEIEPGDYDFGMGLCIYGIFSGELNCPMDELPMLRLNQVVPPVNVLRYEFSVDEKYIAFDYGNSCPPCGSSFIEGTGVVDMQGNLLFDLKEAFSPSFVGWRPAE